MPSIPQFPTRCKSLLGEDEERLLWRVMSLSYWIDISMDTDAIDTMALIRDQQNVVDVLTKLGVSDDLIAGEMKAGYDTALYFRFGFVPKGGV